MMPPRGVRRIYLNLIYLSAWEKRCSPTVAKDGTIRSMRIISLNVGLPCALRYDGREVITGGAKKPVPRAVLRFGNFDGDRQADQVNHGGAEKAVCVYPFDHYPYWNRLLGRDLQPGAFSENLTVSGAIETEVCVGDVFRIGKATVQVSQPRMPCAKLAGKNASRLLPKLMANTGYTGFYMRVLSEGVVAEGDGFDLVRAHPERITIADVNAIIYGKKSNDLALIERLAELPEFSEVGRALFEERRWHYEALYGVGHGDAAHDGDGGAQRDPRVGGGYSATDRGHHGRRRHTR
jgi:MOSC domain-containing protein YiiM